jgi:hypothetical protein
MIAHDMIAHGMIASDMIASDGSTYINLLHLQYVCE